MEKWVSALERGSFFIEKCGPLKFPLQASDFLALFEHIMAKLLIRSGATYLMVAISISAKGLGNDAECNRADLYAVALSQQLRVLGTPRRWETGGQGCRRAFR